MRSPTRKTRSQGVERFTSGVSCFPSRWSWDLKTSLTRVHIFNHKIGETVGSLKHAPCGPELR